MIIQPRQVFNPSTRLLSVKIKLLDFPCIDRLSYPKNKACYKKVSAEFVLSPVLQPEDVDKKKTECCDNNNKKVQAEEEEANCSSIDIATQILREMLEDMMEQQSAVTAGSGDKNDLQMGNCLGQNEPSSNEEPEVHQEQLDQRRPSTLSLYSTSSGCDAFVKLVSVTILTFKLTFYGFFGT